MKPPANDVLAGDLVALLDGLAALAVEFHLDDRFEESVDVNDEPEHERQAGPGGGTDKSGGPR